jgi:hypothetical protein
VLFVVEKIKEPDMKKQVLIHAALWTVLITAETICYAVYRNKAATIATIVRYGTLISSFYLCYFITYRRLRKKEAVLGLGRFYKIVLIGFFAIINIVLHYLLNRYVMHTDYGLTIPAYFLDRLWIIAPILYAVATELEKHHSSYYLSRVKAEYNQLKTQVDLLAETAKKLQDEINDLEKNKKLMEIDAILLKGYADAAKEEYYNSKARIEKLLDILRNRGDFE